jgi:hypothetical protein
MAEAMTVRRRRSAKWITQIVTLVLTIAAGLAVLFVPGYQVVTSDSGGDEMATSATALEHLGAWVVLLTLIPVAIAIAPLLAARRQWQPVTIGATALLAIWCVISAFTIGLYYLPAIALLLASVFMSVPQGRSPRASREST